MRSLLPAGAACALALTACGGADPGPAPAPVRLAVTAPQDLTSVRSTSVEISGTVRPATAVVTVGGRRASVSGGAFTARVGLAAGVNVIDVLASAGRARPALEAIRVRRVLGVRVPDITGLSADDARKALRAVGLQADTQREGGFFDQLLGGDPVVCTTDPQQGATVDAGSTVHVTVSRRC